MKRLFLALALVAALGFAASPVLAADCPMHAQGKEDAKAAEAKPSESKPADAKPCPCGADGQCAKDKEGCKCGADCQCSKGKGEGAKGDQGAKQPGCKECPNHKCGKG